MDGRFDAYRSLGLKEGDAHLIRNAGGVASDDAIRSLVISHWRLGTQRALVIGHTQCGMATFTDEELRELLAEKTRAEVDHLYFLTFSDVDERVRESVRILRETPLLPDDYEVAGLVFDVETGLLRPVE
jgi:carbonic anhydrase